MTYFPNKGDEPGNMAQVPFAGEAGDHHIYGRLTVEGLADFNSDVTFNGNVYFSDETVIDVIDGILYTMADPIINLNTSFTGTYIPEAGLKIFRGAGQDSAWLKFLEDPTRTTKEWRVGVGADLLRIARISDTAVDSHALLWDVASSVITTHPYLVFNPTNITSSIPSYFDLPALTPGSYYRYNEIVDPAFSIERYAAGSFEDALQFGFRSFTYDGTTFTGASATSGEHVYLFRVRNPSHDRTRYVFDGAISIGLDDASTALVRTDLAALRIEGTTSVGLRAGPSGTDQVTITPTLVTVNTDLSFGTGLLTGKDLIVEAAATASLSYYLPAGFNILPTIAGWDGTITYSGVISTLSSSEANARTKYEVKIVHTIAAGAGTNYVVYTPINIGNDMANIRGIYGIVRKMNGALVERVYGLPNNDIAIEAPFNVNPPFLTAANLVGYHLLSINMVRALGTWEIIITIETLHPMVHAP